MTRISFFVEGTPKATQTGTVVRAGKRLLPIRRGTTWSQAVGLVARQYAPPQPFAGPISLTLHLCFTRPKSSRRPHVTVRPDLDNCIKGLADSLNGVLWLDDSQIVDLWVSKRYDLRPGLRVTVEEYMPAGAGAGGQ